MSRQRKTADQIEYEGRNHMGAAELDERRDREVHIPPAEAVTPPTWLPKKLHDDFRRIGEILQTSGLYSDLDQDVLAQYFLCAERWRRADKKASAAIGRGDEAAAKNWTTVQSAYFKQARQSAESMGLSVTARCRIVVPRAVVNAAEAAGGDGDDEFSRRLRSRQERALEQLEG